MSEDEIRAAVKRNLPVNDIDGIKINCCTVDGKCDAERLAEWGIDYITSNILEW